MRGSGWWWWWGMLSGVEEAVQEDKKYEVRRCMCQEQTWRAVTRSASLAESLPWWQLV